MVRAVVVVAVVLALGMGLLGCGDPNVKTGTYVGGNIAFEGDDGSSLPGYMIELADGTKIIAFGEGPAPEVGAEVTIRRESEDDTWEIVPEE